MIINKLFQPGNEIRSQVLPFGSIDYVRFQKIKFIPDIIPDTVKSQTIHIMIPKHQVHGIGQLDLIVLAWLHTTEIVKDFRSKNVPGSYSQVRGSFLDGWFLDEV